MTDDDVGPMWFRVLQNMSKTSNTTAPTPQEPSLAAIAGALARLEARIAAIETTLYGSPRPLR